MARASEYSPAPADLKSFQGELGLSQRVGFRLGLGLGLRFGLGVRLGLGLELELRLGQEGAARGQVKRDVKRAANELEDKVGAAIVIPKVVCAARSDVMHRELDTLGLAQAVGPRLGPAR